MEKKELNNESEMIKTICDFLFFDIYQDYASFSRFEQCFQPLFNSDNISLEKVFKDICGENKKYITYKRFLKAYKEYLNGKKLIFSEDTKKFFNLLFNSILKTEEKSYVGEYRKYITSFTTKRFAPNKKYITMVQVLNDKSGNIHGINLKYNHIFNCEMHPTRNAKDLIICLEMTLNNIDKNSEKVEKKSLINRDISIDAITHIFGTIDKKTGYISFIGFKTISGKTVFVGTPKGDGFLFGQFGKKLQDLSIQLMEEGITRLETGFKQHSRKNFFLDKADDNFDKDELILDEENLGKIEDKDEKEKYIITSIVEDDHFFNKELKDEYCGNDYKEVVDQYPRNWMLKESVPNISDNRIDEKKSNKLDLDGALNLYNKESEKTKKRLDDLNKSVKDCNYKNYFKNIFSSFEKINDVNYKKNKLTNTINPIQYKNLKNESEITITEKKISQSVIVTNQDRCKYYSWNETKNKKKAQIEMKNLKGEIVILDKKDEKNKWEKLRKGIKKFIGIKRSFIKAKNILEKKINASYEEKEKLYEILKKNEKLLFFIPKNNNKSIKEKKEKESFTEIYKNRLIPDLNQENASLGEIQKNIDDLKALLSNKNMNEESKNKLEKLRNLYIQQKNILIEKETKKAKEEIINRNNSIIKKYIKYEIERRSKAKEEEKKKLEEEERLILEEIKIKEFASSVRRIDIKGSIIAQKKSTRIFHKQELPHSNRPWIDNDFPPTKESLCPFTGNQLLYFKELIQSDWEQYNWCRIDDITDFKNNYTIFEEGATIQDIKQGSINDCYFISAIGSLCSFPLFFNKLFYIKEKSEDHIYGIYLFLNGKWKLVLLDDYFPYKILYNDDGIDICLCFGSSSHEELWVSLIEKAWAKVNGCYARIGCRGIMSEAFDVLTEAYTEEIDIRIYKKDNREEELWKLLVYNYTKNYVLAAGTDFFIDDNIGLVPGHAYTLMNFFEIETKIGKERLIKLKNPYGFSEYSGDWNDDSDKWTDEIKNKCKFNDEDANYGIFYMSFSEFFKNFIIVDVAKLENGYQTTYCKIKKEQAIKCQIIRVKIENENTHVYIQLYQKNPRIIKKNRTFYSDKAMCFLILVDKGFKYIKSASGKKTHICIEANLKPGTYYIFSDVNYRNENYSFIHGYMITFYSKNLINNFENVTERIDSIMALGISMYNYCKTNNIKCIDDESRIKIFDSKHSNNEMPFRILTFVNITNNSRKVSINLKLKPKKDKNFCIYNDKIASEFDTRVIKQIKSKNATTLLILEYKLECEYDLEYKILDDNDENTHEKGHPIFKNEENELDAEGCLLSYYSKIDYINGFTLGIYNKSNTSFKLNLKYNDVYDIDSEFFGKDDITFDILPNERKVFNARVKSDADHPRFEFTKIK